MEKLPNAATDRLEPTSVRDVVAGAFHAVLGHDAISTDKGFQAVGGTSMQAILTCARISSDLGVSVPVSLLYKNPSADALAGAICQAQSQSFQAGSSVEKTASATGEVRLSDGQAGFLFRRQMNPADTTTDCPLMWTLTGGIEVSAVEHAMEDIHLHHPELSASYRFGKNGAIVLVDDRSPAPRPLVLSASTIQDATDQTLREMRSLSLDPEGGRNWACVLSTANSGGAALGFKFAHETFDGYSESVFARHFSEAYQSHADLGRPAELPPRLPIADLAALRATSSHRGDGDTESRLRAQAKLAKIRDLVLPVPASRDVLSGGRQGYASKIFSPTEARGIGELARSMHVTVFTVLLALYIRTLKIALKQEDFGIAVPIMQRTHAAMFEAIGCYIDTVCLPASDVVGHSGDQTLEDIIRRTGSAVRQSLEEVDVSYSEMVALARRSRRGLSPLCQTMFAYHDTPHPVLSIGDQEAQFRRIPPRQATLELTVEIRELPNGAMALEIVWDTKFVNEYLARSVHSLLSETIQMLTTTRADLEGSELDG